MNHNSQKFVSGISDKKWILAARSTCNTLVSSFSGCVMAIFYSLYAADGKIDILMIINGILGALVGVTGQWRSAVRVQASANPVNGLQACIIRLVMSSLYCRACIAELVLPSLYCQNCIAKLVLPSLYYQACKYKPILKSLVVIRVVKFSLPVLAS